MKPHLIAALLVIIVAPAFGEARIKPPALDNSMSRQVARLKCEYPSKLAIAALELKLRERRGGLANPNTIIFGIAY